MVTRFELRDLVGCEVSAVCFVRDYVEFRFDGPILRALADPVITAGGERHESPQPGSRDAMCSLIGQVVQRAEDEDDQLLIDFGAANVVIPKASLTAGIEIAHLVPFADGKLDVAAMLIWENSLGSR